jgi:hypothetical protein
VADSILRKLYADLELRRSDMTLCPIAIVAGCKKCPAFALCPLKGVIGDYKKPDESETKQQSNKPNTGDRDR